MSLTNYQLILRNITEKYYIFTLLILCQCTITYIKQNLGVIHWEECRVNCHGLLYGIILAFCAKRTEKCNLDPHLEYSMPEARIQNSYT